MPSSSTTTPGLETVLDWFALPSGSRSGDRIPKTVVADHVELTAADRKFLQSDVLELRSLAVVTPAVSGGPALTGANAVPEVHFLALRLSEGSRDTAARRMAELLHRAIPSPVVLLAIRGGSVAISLASKRRSRAWGDKTTLQEHTWIDSQDAAVPEILALAHQSNLSMDALYESWERNLLLCNTAHMLKLDSIVARLERQGEVRELHARVTSLTADLDAARKAVRREKQVSRRVELNGRIAGLREQLDEVRSGLA